MSGHSKWANIKHRKGSADLKRAALFTKLSKNISIAARAGGDPEFNFSLRAAIDKALSANMTKDKIDHAIKRGTGEIAGGMIEEVLYEGYGPGGAAVLVEALTDNRNRTSASIKHVFAKNGGNMGSSGSVQWMFDRRGVVRGGGKADLSDEDQLRLIEAGVDDISVEDGVQVMTCQPDALAAVRQAASDIGVDVTDAALEWSAKETVQADPSVRVQIEGLFEALDEDEDVSDIYSNVEL
ncbi:MAG: YebC/PmpR family DNA-binding transcriptional regulator [bacterium]